MIKRNVTIKNPTGLHLRPAGELCDAALRFPCTVSFVFKETTGNAKSILSVLGACVKCGDEIELICDGEEEQEAMEYLIDKIESGLGEQ